MVVINVTEEWRLTELNGYRRPQRFWIKTMSSSFLLLLEFEFLFSFLICQALLTFLAHLQVCDRFINRKLVQRLYDRALAIGLKGYAQLYVPIKLISPGKVVIASMMKFGNATHLSCKGNHYLFIYFIIYKYLSFSWILPLVADTRPS